jgi:hypothetical protein
VSPTPPPDKSSTTKQDQSLTPHWRFLQRWLPDSCQAICFYTYDNKISFLGHDIVIPVAVLQEVQPYSYSCSCSAALSIPPSDKSNLLDTIAGLATPSQSHPLSPEPSPPSLIANGFEFEIQTTFMVKNPPFYSYQDSAVLSF